MVDFLRSFSLFILILRLTIDDFQSCLILSWLLVLSVYFEIKALLVGKSFVYHWLIDFLLVNFSVCPSFEELKEDLLELFDLIVTAVPIVYDLNLLPSFDLKLIHRNTITSRSGSILTPEVLVCFAGLLLISSLEQVFSCLHLHELVVYLRESGFFG